MLNLNDSLKKLGSDFPNLNWNFKREKIGNIEEKISQWLGNENDNIMTCVFKGKEIHEPYHRQDFFFINFAYRGNYGALSYRYDNQVIIGEGECYIGQPFSGYALFGASDKEIIIVGVLIKKEVFYRHFLQIIFSDSRLIHFFLNPRIDCFSDEFIHLKNISSPAIRQQIELLVCEYANKNDDSERILLSMTSTLLMLIAREYKNGQPLTSDIPLSEQMLKFIENNMDTVTLKLLGEHFSYNPTYISAYLSNSLGKTFSQILLDFRMKRAKFLIDNTDLSIEEITVLIGYSDKSNFHKAFRLYYGRSPRGQKSKDLPPNI